MQEEYGQEKLSRAMFDEVLRGQVTERFGEGYQVEQVPVRKNNGIWKDTLLIRAEDRECAPSFYLEEMYNSYWAGQPVEALAEHIAETVRREYDDGLREMTHILKREWFEERLFLRLVHYEKNKDELEHAVYVKIHDLAAVFYVLTEQEPDGIKSFRLPKSAWEQENMGTAEAYYDRILKNTERLFPAELLRMEERLLECMEGNDEDDEKQLKQELEAMLQSEGEPIFYVLTNNAKVNGAATVLYADALKGLARRLQTGLWIIPSSVHEVLVLAEPREHEEVLNKMVQEVNKTQLAPEEVLSDHVYYYSAEQGFWAAKE